MCINILSLIVQIYVFDLNDRDHSVLNFFVTLARELDTEEEVRKITQAWNEIQAASLVDKVHTSVSSSETDTKFFSIDVSMQKFLMINE
jgi:hypothetical protein